jgi:putative transcription factor
MAICELCGSGNSVYDCEIEGTVMRVCSECSKFGKVRGSSNVKIVVQEHKRPVSNEPEFVFIQGYGNIVKNAREKLKLTQEDFAKKVSEHKSVIHQIESEHFKPSVDTARKLEKALHIRIIEEVKQDSDNNSNISKNVFKSKASEFTLGDMIKVKKK